jgi:hypothetical protein
MITAKALSLNRSHNPSFTLVAQQAMADLLERVGDAPLVSPDRVFPEYAESKLYQELDRSVKNQPEPVVVVDLASFASVWPALGSMMLKDQERESEEGYTKMQIVIVSNMEWAEQADVENLLRSTDDPAAAAILAGLGRTVHILSGGEDGLLRQENGRSVIQFNQVYSRISGQKGREKKDIAVRVVTSDASRWNFGDFARRLSNFFQVLFTPNAEIDRIIATLEKISPEMARKFASESRGLLKEAFDLAPSKLQSIEDARLFSVQQ